MDDAWKWYTRKSDNSAVFAMLFNGQNHADLARVPGIKIEVDMFAEVRFAVPPDFVPQFASKGDFIAWESGHLFAWNRPSFTSAHVEGKPQGRRLGSKDAGHHNPGNAV
jgi:hypothetical protein